MKRIRLFLVLLACLPLVSLLSVSLGPANVFGLPDMNSEIGRAVFRLRIDRLVAALVTGAALACAGVALQSLLRNPLAEPYLLGISGGAGLGAAVAIVSGLALLGAFTLPASAFAGGVIALASVYALARNGSSVSVYGLIISGAIVGAICSSVIMTLVAINPVEGLHGVIWWMMGSLDSPPESLLAAVSVTVLAGIAILWSMSRELNAMTMGSDMAHHVGVSTPTAMTVSLACAALMTASAVSMTGLIGFVGLIVPHVVRRLSGADHRSLIPASALAGAILLAACDILARTVLSPRELPVGIITALAGGPFFLMILRRKHRDGWLE